MSYQNPLTKNNVTVCGNPHARQTMIFAHGFGTDQTAWSRVAEAFQEDYQQVLYDNVGGGKSDPVAFSPHKYDSLDAYANDVVDICAALDIQDAIMVGHSVSGMISVLAAIKAPQCFSRLILVGASARYLNDGDNNYVGGFEQSDLDALYQGMNSNYQAWVSGFAQLVMGNPDSPHLAERFACSLGAIRPDIAQSVARVIFQSDHRGALAKVDKPTLLIQANDDVAVPLQAAEYLHRQIKDSRLAVIDATGHFPHVSNPDAVIAAIKDFL